MHVAYYVGIPIYNLLISHHGFYYVVGTYVNRYYIMRYIVFYKLLYKCILCKEKYRFRNIDYKLL